MNTIRNLPMQLRNKNRPKVFKKLMFFDDISKKFKNFIIGGKL